MKINDSQNVKEQYVNDEKLSIRISIHEKYSTNKQGFSNWILDQYEIEEGFKILELGCGNGCMWKNCVLPEGVKLYLTDLSEGMLETAKKNEYKTDVIFNKVDIEKIPYEDGSFDMVIANMMLYHVPNLEKALSEVKRVLRKGGKFYCATFGENGIAEYIESLIKNSNFKSPQNKEFTLQNGEEKLKKYFENTEMRKYEDSLEVTQTQDLVDYILSMESFVDIESYKGEKLYRLLESEKVGGKIFVPKDYGMFICRESVKKCCLKNV